jgi:hypothetical protein
MLHNTEEGYLSPGPTGGSLESQLYVTTFEKGITLLFMSRLNLTSERASESASSGSLGINAFIDNLKALKVAGLHLEVSRDNIGAISFYEKMGFEVICEFEHSIGYGMRL